jgi:hypothetical protein
MCFESLPISQNAFCDVEKHKGGILSEKNLSLT